MNFVILVSYSNQIFSLINTYNILSIIGFITRNCKDFKNQNTLKTLFTSLVRSKLEYNPVVWSPYLNTQIQCIENVQNCFLRFKSYKCNIIRVLHLSYQSLLNIFNIQSLSSRRKINDLIFLFKLLRIFLLSGTIKFLKFLCSSI